LVRCSFFGGQGRRWTRKEKVVVVLLLFPSDLLFPGDGLIDDLLPPIGDPTGDDRGWKAPPGDLLSVVLSGAACELASKLEVLLVLGMMSLPETWTT
jgi:hypothetical protein